MSASVYILRHGETLFNVQRKTQGWCDSPLTVLDIMANAQDGDCVLCVSHGGVGISLFNHLVPNPEPGTVPFGNCICYHYEYENGQLAWVETIAPDLSALDDPSLPPQIVWR